MDIIEKTAQDYFIESLRHISQGRRKVVEEGVSLADIVLDIREIESKIAIVIDKINRHSIVPVEILTPVRLVTVGDHVKVDDNEYVVKSFNRADHLDTDADSDRYSLVLFGSVANGEVVAKEIIASGDDEITVLKRL